MIMIWIWLLVAILAHLAQALRIVDEVIEGHVVVQCFEVILGNLDALQYSFTDSYAGHDDNEFVEAVGPAQLEDSAQIDIGLARAGLHFDREIQPLQSTDLLDIVGFLNPIHISQQGLFRQGQMIADTQLRWTDAFAIGMAKLEACLSYRLPVEHTYDRVDCVLLVFE